MTRPIATQHDSFFGLRPRNHSYRISGTQYRFVATTPAVDPELWEAYLEGAIAGYRKFGVEDALELDRIRDGSSTSIFFVAVDGDDRVVAGVRAQGPYRSAEESHVMVEWAGHKGEADARKAITDRLPFGVVEMKAAWVADDAEDKGELAKAIARTNLPAMVMLDAQFVLATAADYVLDQWAASGGVVSTTVEPAPYPSDRYRTRMMWWDRRTFADHADPAQVPKMLSEMMELTSTVEWHPRERHLQSVAL